MKRKKQTNKTTKTRIHNPEDIAEVVESFGCTERHARRILSEHGKEYALQMRELQAEKLRLQIQRIEIWLADMEKKYVHRDVIERDTRSAVAVVKRALDELVARLVRELPGHTAPEMGRLIDAAVYDCQWAMHDYMGEEIAKKNAIAV